MFQPRCNTPSSSSRFRRWYSPKRKNVTGSFTANRKSETVNGMTTKGLHYTNHFVYTVHFRPTISFLWCYRPTTSSPTISFLWCYRPTTSSVTSKKWNGGTGSGWSVTSKKWNGGTGSGWCIRSVRCKGDFFEMKWWDWKGERSSRFCSEVNSTRTHFELDCDLISRHMYCIVVGDRVKVGNFFPPKKLYQLPMSLSDLDVYPKPTPHLFIYSLRLLTVTFNEVVGVCFLHI